MALQTFEVTVLVEETGAETGDVLTFMAQDKPDLWRALAYYLQLGNGRAALRVGPTGWAAYCFGRAYVAKQCGGDARAAARFDGAMA